MLLPAGRRLQLFYRRTLSAAEQVDAGLLLGLFLGRRFGPAASANGTLPARLPFRPPSLFCRPSSHSSALALGRLDRVCNSRLVNRMRFGHRVVLQLGIRASCAVLPPPKAPPWRRGALGRWPHALLGHQRRQHGRFLRRRSPVECARLKPIAPLRQVNDRQKAAGRVVKAELWRIKPGRPPPSTKKRYCSRSRRHHLTSGDFSVTHRTYFSMPFKPPENCHAFEASVTHSDSRVREGKS